MASSHILQIFLRVTVQNQIRIAQRIVVDEVVQFRPLRHGRVQFILDPSAVNGDHSPIQEQQLHAAGVHVEFAGSCIVLHAHVLLKSCHRLYRSIYDFGFHLPRTPILNFPKKTNNPNPSPIGNKFGLFLFGPSGENRTHGLLNPIVLLSKTQWTLRYHLYAVSSNFKIILSFCFVRCQDVSFLLWSNCGQPTLTNDHSPLLSYMAQFRFSKIEIALFCLHELFIRRICQPCQ